MQKIPFSEKELEVKGYYYVAGNEDKVILNTPITPRENYRAFLRNETPCWMPNGDLITINPEIIPDNISRAFVQEANPTDKKGGPDMFGVNWVFEPLANGSMVIPGNPILKDVNDWRSAIPFPDVDSWDWAGSAERNKEFVKGDSPIWTTQFTGLFERLISFMDFQEAAVALIDEDQQDAVHELFNALTDTYIKIIDHCIEAYHIDGYLFHDDWGSQRSPFFSGDTWLEMIAPYIKKLVDHCHSKGVIFELHSCGNTQSITKEITSIGIDMWRPQPMNDVKKMYEEYGDRIKFGIRGPLCPPSTPVEEQEAFAKKMVDDFNIPGKYVFTSNPLAPNPFRVALYKYSRLAYLEH